jgi:1-acyl-sn-glycerol-3-phosphate acyltransferase
VERLNGRAHLGEVLRSLVFYFVFYLGTALYSLWSLLLHRLGGRGLLNTVRNWSRFHRDCARYILGIKVRVEGELPSEPVLVAMKHESFFEAIDMPTLLPQPAIFAKAELFRIPVWGPAGLAYGLVPVEREQGAKALRSMIGAAKRLSAENRPLAIFPEGTRVPHGTRPALQSGFAGIYKLLGLPVVPIAIDSGPLYHRRWKRRGTITIRFGDTIPAGLPRDEIEARVRVAINVLNAEPAA